MIKKKRPLSRDSDGKKLLPSLQKFFGEVILW